MKTLLSPFLQCGSEGELDRTEPRRETPLIRSRAAGRKTENQVLGTSNIYEELRDRQEARDAAMRARIEKHRQMQRVLEAKMAYLTKMQESHGSHYRPGDTSQVCKVIGERQCVIGDMPGWELSPDTWLLSETSRRPDVYFAIGADGLLYCSRHPSERNSFMQVEDRLMEYSTEQLAHLADSIEAYIAGSAKMILDLMAVRGEYLQAKASTSS